MNILDLLADIELFAKLPPATQTDLLKIKFPNTPDLPVKSISRRLFLIPTPSPIETNPTPIEATTNQLCPLTRKYFSATAYSTLTVIRPKKASYLPDYKLTARTKQINTPHNLLLTYAQIEIMLEDLTTLLIEENIEELPY